MKTKKQPSAFKTAQKEQKRILGNLLQRSAIREEVKAVGGIGLPSKMPGYAYGISAERCITGSKLREIPGSICHGCYATKANYQYPSVKKAHEARWEALQDLETWTGNMSKILGYLGSMLPDSERFFRWHDSGDLQGIEHLDAIVQVALRNPEWRFWLPTKEYGMVRKYKERGEFPGNLTVRISAPMVNRACPGALQTLTGSFSTVGSNPEERCPAYDQEGFCGTCRKCWDPKEAQTDYPLH